MKLVPLGENVIVRPAEVDLQTAGGIHLPEAFRDRPRQGKVLSVGDGRRLADGRHAAPQVHDGDRVLFEHWSAAEVEINGKTLLILNERNILAIVR